MHKKKSTKDILKGTRYLFNRKEGHLKIFYTNPDINPSTYVQVYLKDLKSGPANIPVSANITKNFMRQLAKNGTLTNAGFSSNEVEQAFINGRIPTGFVVQQIVPAGCGARPTPNNLCLMENGLSSYFTRHLWKYFHQDLKAEKEGCEKKGRPLEKISIALSEFKPIMYVNDWQKVLSKPLLKQAKILEEEIKIQKLKKMPMTVLSTKEGVLLAHPAFMPSNINSIFKNSLDMTPAIINVRLTSPFEQQKIQSEYTQVRRNIIKAFAHHTKLPEIRPDRQVEIAQTGWLPNGYSYTCHHIVPRALGGSNKMENICWLSASEHTKMHIIVNRYLYELKTHYNHLASRGKAYLLMPVPASFNGNELRIISPIDRKLVPVVEFASRIFSEFCHHYPTQNHKKKKNNLSKNIKGRILLAHYQNKAKKQVLDISRIHI